MPTYSYYHLITRIYLAYRFRTHLALPHPESLRPSRARVIVARPRFLLPPLRLLRPIKSFISSSYFFSLWVLFVRTFVYHVLPDLSLMCYLNQYLVRYPGFSRYSLLVSGLPLSLRHFIFVWSSLLRLAIMRFLYLGTHVSLVVMIIDKFDNSIGYFHP